jgi:molybdate transport system substrate-binding protein
VILLSYLLSITASAENIHIAVASNFTAAMKSIVTAFEEDTGHKVIVSYGSSGKIYAQIQHHAPFQLFLSADQSKPKALEEDGLTIPGSRFTYAIGALALWSAKVDFIDKEYRPLKQGRFDKLALANPKLAPYGVAALEVLEKLNLKSSTQTKWVQGENIAQTYQFVASGNAELGFVALSQIMDKGHVSTGSSWLIPHHLYNPIRQDAVLLKSAQHSAAAKTLLAYLRSDKAREIIHSYGYQTE